MDQEENIFRVEVNEKGTQSILHIYRIVQVCFWMGIIINLVSLYAALHNYFKYKSILKSTPAFYATRFLVLIIYILLFSIIYFFQFYFFLKFSQQAKKSIRLNESGLFNESLTWLYRAFSMTVIALGFNGLYVIYAIFGDRTL